LKTKSGKLADFWIFAKKVKELSDSGEIWTKHGGYPGE
jgi:hypothetical protein